LDAPDRVTLTIQKMANAAQEIEIVWPVIAATAATLHRPDLAEATFPNRSTCCGTSSSCATSLMVRNAPGAFSTAALLLVYGDAIFAGRTRR